MADFKDGEVVKYSRYGREEAGTYHILNNGEQYIVNGKERISIDSTRHIKHIDGWISKYDQGEIVEARDAHFGTQPYIASWRKGTLVFIPTGEEYVYAENEKIFIYNEVVQIRPIKKDIEQQKSVELFDVSSIEYDEFLKDNSEPIPRFEDIRIEYGENMAKSWLPRDADVHHERYTAAQYAKQVDKWKTKHDEKLIKAFESTIIKQSSDISRELQVKQSDFIYQIKKLFKKLDSE